MATAGTSRNPNDIIAPEDEEEWIYKYLGDWTPRLVFAESVLNFVMSEKQVPYSTQMFNNTKGPKPPNPVGHGMTKCFQNLILMLEGDVKTVYETRMRPCTPELFKKVTIECTLGIDNVEEWTASSLLTFSVMACLMACKAYQKRVKDAPQFAVLLIMWQMDNWSETGSMPADLWAEVIEAGDEVANIPRFQDVSWMKSVRDRDARLDARAKSKQKKDEKKRERERRGEGSRREDRNRERNLEEDRRRWEDFNRWKSQVKRSMDDVYEFFVSDDSSTEVGEE